MDDNHVNKQQRGGDAAPRRGGISELIFKSFYAVEQVSAHDNIVIGLPYKTMRQL